MANGQPDRIVETVPTALAGERLDRIVAFITGVSRSAARSLVEDGGVSVDGVEMLSGKERLIEGVEVAVDLSKLGGVELPQPQADVDFDVIYEDAAIIVIDKPAGLVVHPAPGNPDGTLVNGLLARYPEIAAVGEPQRPGIVHRLDAGSSGLMVVARTQEAATNLIGQFADHSAGRRYRALVWGHPQNQHAVIDAPVGRSRRDPLRMAVIADGRWARTEYTVEQEFTDPANLALIECQLETGRTHQIRVHLSSINHPLVGDPVYGQGRPPLGLTRPFLHAERLDIEHPVDGRHLEFESPLPPDLADRLERCS